MKVLWKGFIEEQIWYGIKTEKARSESRLHYSELPLNEIYETVSFDSAYAYLENHGTAARQGSRLPQSRPLIIFNSLDSWNIAHINKRKFKKYRHVTKCMECPISKYSLADLQDNLPATEFIDFLKDNFENPLTNPKECDIIILVKRKDEVGLNRKGGAPQDDLHGAYGNARGSRKTSAQERILTSSLFKKFLKTS